MAEPLIGIVMGSQSDWETMRARRRGAGRRSACAYEVRIVSAHRTPDRLFAYAEAAAGRGLQGDHRRRRRRGAPAGHARGEDAAAGARRAGAVEGARRARFAAVDRADAEGRAGRHAGDRAGRRGQRRAARGGDAGDRPTRRSPARLEAWRAAQTDGGGGGAAMAPEPLPPGSRDRHPRRRPARADAGDGRGAARDADAMSSSRRRTPPAAQVANAVTRAGYDDAAALARLRRRRSTW